jgi:opacity protein-like surface antigen
MRSDMSYTWVGFAGKRCRASAWILVAVLAWAIWPVVASAQGSFGYGKTAERAQNWDFALQLLYQGSETSSGPNGSSADIDEELGLGFLFNYNFTNRLALGFDFNWVNPRYSAVLVPEDGSASRTINHKLDMFTGQFKGVFNLLEGPITPYAELSGGWTYIDSNVANAPPINGCWWDPWWGYVCSSFYSTYDDSSFSYGGGLGVRWDFGQNYFMRASYNILKLDVGAGDPTFNSGRLEFGVRY